jgi:hypothetical protein
MWLKESVNQKMTWEEAIHWADNLVFAGYDDWRLPSAIHFDTGLPDTRLNSKRNEWGHLYGDEWDNPYSMTDIQPMEGYADHFYWTKTENPNDSSQAYGFFVSYDGVWIIESLYKREEWWVTAVRGPEPDEADHPIASYKESYHSANEGVTIEYDPSNSYDPDGTIVRYEWDLDGDGIYEYSTTTPEVVSHTYNEAGGYAVSLRVTDDDGLTDTVTYIKVIRPYYLSVLLWLLLGITVIWLVLVIGLYYIIWKKLYKIAPR